MEHAPTLYGILCHRFSGSVFGPATALAKRSDDSGYAIFDTLEAADNQARIWQARAGNARVAYTAVALSDDGITAVD